MAHVLLTISAGPAGVRKLLVVKQIRPELVHDAEFVAMFLDEARLAARLSHPNVVHVYEVGIEDSGPFIVMEYLDGQSMQALISKVKRGNMPLDVHLRIICKVLAGLDYAHELSDYNGTPLSVVHRDVSPQNVFICYDGHVKVVDFGVAKVAGAADRTAAGTFKGKIGYIAPEQLSGGNVDRRADVFSVGVMLWEALCQRRLTANETAATAVHKRLHGTLPSVKSVNPQVPDELAAICDKATALVPDSRYLTAAELLEDLEGYMENAGLRPDDREISALVSEAFVTERAKIKQIIEQQIGWASEGKTKIKLPNLGTEKSAGSLSPPGMGVSSSPPFTATRPSYPASSKNRWVAITGSIGLVVIVLLLIARWSASPAAAPSASAASSAAIVAKTVAPAAEPSSRPTVTLTIRVTPAKAAVLLDGATLPSNPFHAAVPKDGTLHKLTASSPGFSTEERLLQYDQDAIIDLVLKRGPAARGGPPAAANEGAAAPGADLKKTPRPKHSVDEEDPYQ
jgi:serine/threonine-protein kinase